MDKLAFTQKAADILSKIGEKCLDTEFSGYSTEESLIELFKFTLLHLEFESSHSIVELMVHQRDYLKIQKEKMQYVEKEQYEKAIVCRDT